MKKSFLIFIILISSLYAFSDITKATDYFKNELSSGNIQIKTQDKKIVFIVPFNFSEIMPYGKTRATLLKVSQYIKLFPSYLIEIIGHTDNIKPRLPETIKVYPDLNAYSLGRANSVKSLLISAGIKASQIKTSGAGDSNPVADNNSEEGRSKNRRVELIVDLGIGQIPSQAINQIKPQTQQKKDEKPKIEVTQPNVQNPNLPPSSGGDRPRY